MNDYGVCDDFHYPGQCISISLIAAVRLVNPRLGMEGLKSMTPLSG
jgi:hypothetical protein